MLRGMSKAADLPNDVEALVLSQRLELEKLRFEIACLKRKKYGRSSEQLDQQLTQMQLSIEDLETSLAQKPVEIRSVPKEPLARPLRGPLPGHLPREEIVHDPPCTCPACGGELRRLGEDVSEVLEYVLGRYKVIRHVRPKLSCATCQKILQVSAPSRPIERGLAGPGLLAHVLVSKYADHLPLYRQSQIYAREGLELERSTLADWLFAGSDDGGERAAAIYTLIGTTKLNDLNPEAHLRHVLERIADHPINRIEELLPWNVAAQLPSIRLAA